MPRRDPIRFAQLAALTPAPGATVDWAAIWPLWPALGALDACPQDPEHHAEGDVGTHTRMVVEALIAEPDWRALPPERRSLLFWAAVLHDIGKPATTRAEDGRLTARGHSRRGAAMARRLLWEAEAPFVWRETLCGLILAHQLPFWLIERPAPERLAIETSWRCRGDDLCLHAQADALGRISASRDALLDNIALARTVFEETGCLDRPYPFANDESRVAFFEREDRDPAYAAHETFRCRAIVMSGLPGAGKDRWIASQAPDLPVVSLDALRAELGASATGSQGRVAQAAQERAREHLRAGRDFVWNATNVTRQTRGKVLRLLRDYGAEIHVVYVEAPPDRLLGQNAARAAQVPEKQVPEKVVLDLAEKLEPPTLHEAHRVTWVVDAAG